ncbi:sulfatase-like hydrolase/transferase [Flindersiella endophytica]
MLVLMADDHRHDLFGVAGAELLRTPAFDSLAGRGTRYLRAHCQGGMTGAICAPSRAILMTGVELFGATASTVPGEPGVHEINPALTTMPEAFGKAGYRTYGIGKWHNGRAAYARSFTGGAKVFFGGMSDHDAVPVHDYDPTGEYPDDASYPADGFSTDVFADATIDFLRSRTDAGDEPFFCYTAFTAPHDPRTPPETYTYDPADVELPPNFLAEHPFDNGDLHARDEELAAHPRTPDEVRQHIADYNGMITHLDHGVGRILEALADAGLADNTIVVYTGDHGLAVGQHGLMGKQNLYDHSVRIPLMVAGPGVPSGATEERLAGQADIFPMLADLCGVERPPVPAELAPIAGGRDGGSRTHVHAAYLDVQRMVSTGRHKLIRYHRSRDRGTDHLQLFDLEQDPWEQHNLADDPSYAEIRAALEAELTAWQRKQHDPLAGRE